MEVMKHVNQAYFDLACVDPPYGGGDIASHTPRAKGTTKNKIHKATVWNIAPEGEYFDQLFRVSKNQIIWGANHYPQFLTSSRGWVFWDKLYENTFNFSAGELAYTSFDRVLKMFRCSQRWIPNTPLNIHPCQKPVKLYEWLLKNYAKEGDRILDTHLGSGSSAIAAHYAGFDFVGCELDEDYYKAACERFDRETRQQALAI
ncbi:MAG: DNA methyltransferase [Candidatus Paceibacterota bacterium]